LVFIEHALINLANTGDGSSIAMALAIDEVPFVEGAALFILEDLEALSLRPSILVEHLSSIVGTGPPLDPVGLPLGHGFRISIQFTLGLLLALSLGVVGGEVEGAQHLVDVFNGLVPQLIVAIVKVLQSKRVVDLPDMSVNLVAERILDQLRHILHGVELLKVLKVVCRHIRRKF
jgi:hypothetical protein